MPNPAGNKSTIIRGWILIVIGVALTIGMTALTVWFASAVHNTTTHGPQWTGSHAMTMQVYELFAAVILFGLTSIGAGIFQVRTGRLSRIAFVTMLALVVIMFFLGREIMSANPTS